MKKIKTSFQGQQSHKTRVAAALRRRLGGPDYPSTVKQLAGLLGCAGQTVHYWLMGSCDPKSYWMGELVGLFGPSFLFEIYGERVVAFENGGGRSDERRPPTPAIQGRSLAPAPTPKRA